MKIRNSHSRQPEARVRRLRRILLGMTSLAALSSLFAGRAAAQTVDYGALEQLFGEPVTTSATGTPQRASEVPVNMTIVTADDIRRSGAHDIPGVLRHVVGIDVMRWNNDNADVGLRGYDQTYSPRVLVLIDGRQVYSDLYGYISWASLPVELSAIRQIEVIKGPNAAIYGFNAVNGVINIITYNPLYDDVTTASASGGTQGFAEGSGLKTFKLSDWGAVRLSAGARRDNDFSTSTPGFARQANERFVFGADGVFRLADNVSLGIDASHSIAKTNSLDPSYAMARDDNVNTSFKGQLTADTGYGLLQGSVTFNGVGEHFSNVNFSFADVTAQDTIAQAQDIVKLGPDHVVRLNLEYRFSSAHTGPFTGGRIYFSDYALGGMWDWHIYSDLSATVALRWENLHLGRSGAVPADYPFTNSDWRRTIDELSWTGGLVWKATEVDTFRLMTSQGDQLPSLVSLGAYVARIPGNASGNPGLEPTDVFNYEADWDRQLPMIGGEFRGAAFFIRSEDASSIAGLLVPGPGLPYALPTSVGNSTATGVELSVNGVVQQDWRWGLNYRFETIEDRFAPFAANGVDFTDYQHVTPKHLIKANLGWSGGNWEIDGFAYYQSPTKGLAALPFGAGSFLTRVPDYVSFDARLAYKLADWATVAVSGQDLAASPQAQTSGPKVERRVIATLTVTY